MRNPICSTQIPQSVAFIAYNTFIFMFLKRNNNIIAIRESTRGYRKGNVGIRIPQR